MTTMIPVAARRTVRVWAGALVVLLAPVVAGASDTLPASDMPRQRTEQIARMIGSAACDADSQCRVIGIGARACGGPQSYAAWSAAHTDPAALQHLVEFDARAQRKELEAKGVEAPCVVLPVPGVRCQRTDGPNSGGGHCVLVQSRIGSSTLR